MRLHRLTVSAFGPFAGTEHVDFDELNRAGLFLLTGATGAGKSSLLDAVCFALYGTVPGARGVKALKSQHSPPDAQPHVVLDFSVRGRRFVVRRTPEWSRPKRRGEGLLTEKASALITETTGGMDHFLSSRAAEVGLLVGELMGMSAAQFAQVALLPQGEFQTFLRASSQDRHDVLQRLFRTDRFAAIEEFVGDHSRHLRDQASAGASTVQRILDTVADRAEAELPADLCGDALPAAAAEGRVLPWVGAALRAAEAGAELALAAGRESVAALETARRRHLDVVRRADERRRVEQARAALALLETSDAAARDARTAILADDRAARCRPVLALRAQEVSARQRAAVRAETAVRDLTRSPALRSGSVPLAAASSAADLADLTETVRVRSARLEALLPREQAADRLRHRLADERRLLEAAEGDRRAIAERADRIPRDLESCVARLAEVTTKAARSEALTLGREAAVERQSAAVELEVLSARLVQLEDRRREARDLAQDARQLTQDLMARRLAGMAAELAGALTAGSACSVCGSTAHPRPASAGGDAVTVDDQESAAVELRRREAEVETADAALHSLRSRHETVAAAAGGRSSAEATADVAVLGAALAEAAAALRDQHRLEAEATALRAEQEEVARQRLAVAQVVAGLEQSVGDGQDSLAEIERELEDALEPHAEPGASPRPGVQASAVAVRALLQQLTDAQQATAALEEADARLRSVTEQALGAAAEQGFASLGEVEAAALSDDSRRRSTELLEERAAVEGQARGVLEDPALRADDVSETSTDLDLLVVSLATRSAEAEAVADAAARRSAVEEERGAAVALLAGRLSAAIQEWSPVRDVALRADALSKLVRGMGQDNQLQMRLSAYVLATRLDQVVSAANERLGHMRDQRYLLQRTGRAERRTSQAGLGLEVVDQWTGDVRAPTTLSGGETFVVSLSLALGLADVVTQESGGTEIETLFVDEGFGTLDADTLDDVMDRLDGLRAGGRTVGVVSHVTELRSRIPTQVQVEKGRSGSTVTVRTLVG